MILFAIIFIVIEVKRAKVLRYLDVEDADALKYFQPIALKLYLIETLLILTMAAWMLL